jgi:hypothetical protein
MDNPRFLRIQPHIQLFQYSSRSGQRSTRFSRRLTGDYPIIGNPAIGIAVTHQVLQADSVIVLAFSGPPRRNGRACSYFSGLSGDRAGLSF